LLVAYQRRIFQGASPSGFLDLQHWLMRTSAVHCELGLYSVSMTRAKQQGVGVCQAGVWTFWPSAFDAFAQRTSHHRTSRSHVVRVDISSQNSVVHAWACRIFRLRTCAVAPSLLKLGFSTAASFHPGNSHLVMAAVNNTAAQAYKPRQQQRRLQAHPPTLSLTQLLSLHLNLCLDQSVMSC
jgi:hypothetical protein